MRFCERKRLALAALYRGNAIAAVAKLQGQSVCHGTSALPSIEIEQEIQDVRRFCRTR